MQAPLHRYTVGVLYSPECQRSCIQGPFSHENHEIFNANEQCSAILRGPIFAFRSTSRQEAPWGAWNQHEVLGGQPGQPPRNPAWFWLAKLPHGAFERREDYGSVLRRTEWGDGWPMPSRWSPVFSTLRTLWSGDSFPSLKPDFSN